MLYQGVKTTLTISLALFTLVGAFGCATTTHFPMEQETRESIETINVGIGVFQPEIEPTVEEANTGGQGGFVGVVIASTITQKRMETAEELISPIRDALIDYDFVTTAKNSVEPQLSLLPWEIDSDLFVSRSSLEESYAANIENTTEDALLILTYDYRTSPDFSTIQVNMQALMFPTRPEMDHLRDAGRPANTNESPTSPKLALYRNVFTVEVALPDRTNYVPMYAELWAEDEGRRAQEAFSLALSRIASMFINDIQMVAGEVKGTGERMTHQINGRRARIAYKTDGYTVYRQHNGALYSFSSIPE